MIQGTVADDRFSLIFSFFKVVVVKGEFDNFSDENINFCYSLFVKLSLDNHYFKNRKYQTYQRKFVFGNSSMYHYLSGLKINFEVYKTEFCFSSFVA